VLGGVEARVRRGACFPIWSRINSTFAVEPNRRTVSGASGRRMPNRRCSLSVAAQLDWIASYRARKTAFRAVSVNRSNR
jgi:hypothetical protein